MDGFDKKTLKTSRGYTYTYYTSAGDSSLPTLLLHHGFPDHAAVWHQVASALKSTQHPMIIPDMLGYDGTDKPTDPSAYTFDLITQDLVEILDAENTRQCIAIGHDWGSPAASRLYQYHPDRVCGLANLNVPYIPLYRQAYDLDAANAAAQQAFGYPSLMYWYLFSAPEGAAVIEGDIALFHDIFHSHADGMKYFFCTKDAMRNALEHKTPTPEFPTRAYARDPAFKQAFIERMKRDGFEGPLCWYKATVRSLQYQSDVKLPEERQTVRVPTLYMGGAQDVVCRQEYMDEAVQNGWLPHLEHAGMLEAGHWTPYEAPGEVVAKLEAWLRKNFAK